MATSDDSLVTPSGRVAACIIRIGALLTVKNATTATERTMAPIQIRSLVI